MKAKKALPRCPVCEEMARPNILMFGDWNWLGDRTEDQQNRFSQWLKRNANSRVAVIECGAGTGVPTVRMTSENIVSRFNGTLIRINTTFPLPTVYQRPSGKFRG